MKAALPKRDKNGPQGRKRDCAPGGVAPQGAGSPEESQGGRMSAARRLRAKNKKALRRTSAERFFMFGEAQPGDQEGSRLSSKTI